ncbi:TraB/GumN family protein [Comamonadaceae bacterium OH2545_COT-014]|nr:TraB/GumN family protein [Comamonadaceae bacterium OH2545_COT-014]
MRQLADAWAHGDLARLERYPEWCQCMDTEADRARMARLLQARNGPMAERFAALHAEGQRVFLAVGALHMTGPQGMPALLRARGFSVRRVLPGAGMAVEGPAVPSIQKP